MASTTKLALLMALFGIIALEAAYAATYTTVVTVEETNPRGESCQREVEQMQFRHCMQWMTGGSRPFLRSAVANPGYGEEEHLRECCGELQNIRSECRCEAIRHMMRQMQKQYGAQEEMERMMMQKAESLPMMCRWDSPKQCSIRAIFY